MAFGGSGFGGNLFGNTQSAFGTPAPVFGQSSSFGASSSGFGAASSGFGAFSQSQSQSPWGTGTVPSFGQQNVFQQQPVGNPPSTRTVKWQISQLHDTNSTDPSRFHSISAMNQFQQFSVEELRLGDYGRGDKGGQQSGFGNSSGMESSGFGASGFGQSASGFGAAGNAFGSSSQPLFGNTTSAFGGGNTLFGQTQQQQQATGFGSFGQTQSGFGQQPSGFGQSASGFGSSGGAVFGASVFGGNTGFGQTAAQAQSGGFGSGFGSTGGSGFGAASTGGFGAQGASSSAFGASGFGASSQSLFGGGSQQQSAGLFGSQQTGASLFGQQSAASGFGTPAQSASSLFGGQSSGGGSLFGGQQQTGSALFGGGQSSAGGLFGGTQQTNAGLFGNQQGGGGQFGASSSAFGASSLFGTGSQQSASLFGGSGFGSSAGGGLFGSGSTGSTLFGNTSSGLFGSGSGAGFGASSSSLFGTQPSGSLFGNTGSGFGMSGSMFGSGTGFGFGNQQQQQQLQQQQHQQQGPLEASLTNNPFGNSNLFGNIPEDSSLSLLPLESQGTQGKTVSVVVGPIGGLTRRSRVGDELQIRPLHGSRVTTDSWYRPRARQWSRKGSLFDLDDMMREKDHSRDFVTPWRTEEQRVRARNLKKLFIEPIDEDTVVEPATQSPGARIRRKAKVVDDTPVSQQLSESRTLQSQQALVENTTDKLEQKEVKDDEEETVLEVNESDSIGPSNKEEPQERTVFDVKKEEEVLEPARYVPYVGFYGNQYSNDRSKSKNDEIHQADAKNKGSIIPTCRRPDYVTIPSIGALQDMSEEELSHVQGFTIYRENIGEVRWETAVDLRRLNLDEIVSIEPGTVTIYPSNDSIPQPGEELNKPAVIRMHGVWKKKGGVVQKDAHSVAKMVKNLKHHCDREGLQFLGYDVGRGTWSFRAQHF